MTVISIALMGLLGSFFTLIGLRHLFGPVAADTVIARRQWPYAIMRIIGLLELSSGALILYGIWSPMHGVIGAVVALILTLFFLLANLFGDRKALGKPFIVVLALFAAVATRASQAIDQFTVLMSSPDPAPIALAPAREVGRYPGMMPALFESIVPTPEGHFFITIGNKGQIWRIEADGKAAVLAELPTGGYGKKRFQGVIGTLVMGLDGNLYVTLVALDPANRGVWQVSSDGKSKRLFARLPAESQPNGITIDSQGNFFVADSNMATVWKINRTTAAVTAWAKEPELFGRVINWAAPGANGIKFFGNALYVSNSFTGNVIRVPIRGNGTADRGTVYATGLPGDDFAFDEKGSLYLTTHPGNSVIRVDPDGKRTVIANADTKVVGPTAAMFGVGAKDRLTLYVINDGGFVIPHKDGAPNIIAVETGVAGHKIGP